MLVMLFSGGSFHTLGHFTACCENNFLVSSKAFWMHSDLRKAAGPSAILNAKILDGLNHSQLNDALVQLLGDRQQLRKSFLMRSCALPASVHRCPVHTIVSS